MLSQSEGRTRNKRRIPAAAIMVAFLLAAVPLREAAALITGGEGNKPIADPGWPKGAGAIFNHPGRVAWWEGPPFGGGQWHSECRGDAKTLSAILTGLSKLDAKTKRVVVHDGVGHSFWINPNSEPGKKDAARIDWVFMIWQPASWERLSQMPAGINPTDAKDRSDGPPSQVDVYTGGNVHWADVKVPDGLEVVDERLESHGFTVADGVVLEGKITDVADKRPVAGRVKLRRMEPRGLGPERYTVMAEAMADANGHWVLKKVLAGWVQVVIEADDYVPRVVGYARFDDQPHWSFYDGRLSRHAPVTGKVVDESGQPLAGVEVRIQDVATEEDGRYDLPVDASVKTDGDGRFRYDQLPRGKASVWVYKFGYCRPGLGLKITLPQDGVALTMTKSARVRVTVDFSGKAKPEGYIVNITPEGGNVVGSWGGSGNIDAQNQIAFTDVPPGRYTLQGQPNPGSANEHTPPVPVDLKGGRLTEITLKAK
jgi:Carboxypeptidase regulatory-like domain